jgi:hypothetical protein
LPQQAKCTNLVWTDLDFEDGATMLIQLAEATSSVMVRAKDQTLAYAD